MEHEHFLDVVQHGWTLPTNQTDCAKIISAKFKNLRRVIRTWQAHLSSLKANITNVKLVLSFLCILEEFRDLTLMEWNFRNTLQQKLVSLLKQQHVYWKQRGTIRWVTTGDTGTKFFHAHATIKQQQQQTNNNNIAFFPKQIGVGSHATIKHRRKLITMLEDQSGNLHSDRNSKVGTSGFSGHAAGPWHLAAGFI